MIDISEVLSKPCMSHIEKQRTYLYALFENHQTHIVLLFVWVTEAGNILQ